MKTKIIVMPYNPDWAIQFQAFKKIYQNHMQDAILDIQHVGSTAVVGLAAKPILDIDIIVENRTKMETVIQKLAALGYRHVGDLGIVGREVFKPLAAHVPYPDTTTNAPRHHLYACIQGAASLENHLALRDYLRQHPAARQAYSQLKYQLAQAHPYDIDAYVEGKTAFITNILARQGFKQTTLSDITQQNKKPIFHEILGDPTPFLKKIFNHLAKDRIDVRNYELDHICYRVATEAQYQQKKAALAMIGTLLVESQINGRAISTFKLNKPIQYENRFIYWVELPAPKPNSTYVEGFEHVEFVIDTNLVDFQTQYSHISFDTKGLSKQVNPDLRIKYQDCSVKFHLYNLAYVIQYLD